LYPGRQFRKEIYGKFKKIAQIDDKLKKSNIKIKLSSGKMTNLELNFVSTISDIHWYLQNSFPIEDEYMLTLYGKPLIDS
jgi:hypothetical protein